MSDYSSNKSPRQLYAMGTLNGTERIPCQNPTSVQVEYTTAQDIAALGGITGDTYANWQTKATAGELFAGQWILVADSGDTDLGLVLQTIDSGNVSGNLAYGGFLNADIQGEGDYTGAVNVTGVAFASLAGFWNSGIDSLNLGDVYIWNNEHYQVIVGGFIGFGGPAPDIDTTHYAPLTRADHKNGNLCGYIRAWDLVTYDFVTDQVLYRMDKRGNRINRNSFSNFQWGDDNIKNVWQNNSTSYISTLNNSGSVSGFDNSKFGNFNFAGNTGNIDFVVNGVYQYINSPDNHGWCEFNLNGFSVGVDADTNYGTLVTYLYNYAYLNANNNSGNIRSRHYDRSITTITNNIGNFYDLEVAKSCTLEVPFATGTYENCKFAINATVAMPADGNFAGKEITDAGSTFNWDADISASIIVSNTLTMPNWAGIVTFRERYE